MKPSTLPLAGSLLLLAGCAQGPPEEAAPPPVVTAAAAVRRDVTDYAEFSGRTMAVESVNIRARLWGHLRKFNFVEGAEVKKGAVLFVIDPLPYRAALERAEADVTQSRARIKRLQAD